MPDIVFTYKFQYTYEHKEGIFIASSKSFPTKKLQGFSLPELRKVIKFFIEDNIKTESGDIPVFQFDLIYVSRL